jgi:hypothetical protein
MSTLIINNLEKCEELDKNAMQEAKGGFWPWVAVYVGSKVGVYVIDKITKRDNRVW